MRSTIFAPRSNNSSQIRCAVTASTPDSRQRILSSRFAQNHAIRGNGTLYNLLILLVCNCPALFGFEYTVGQIWDKSISHGFRKGPIHIREGAKKPFREYRNEDGCHARPKTKKPFLKIFLKILNKALYGSMRSLEWKNTKSILGYW
jgi:hypothetical protein